MNKRTVLIASIVAVLVVGLVIANQWRSEPQRVESEAIATTASPVQRAGGEVDLAVGDAHDSRAPSESLPAEPVAIDGADEAPKESVPARQPFEELVAGIDPSLGDKNVIVRAGDPATKAPDLAEAETQFRTESTDPTWSKQMESQIVDQVSRLSGLGLVRFDAECRETICRIKLFYPPGTNALSSLEQLKPLATQLGFHDIVEAATIGEDGVPMSLLYLHGL